MRYYENNTRDQQKYLLLASERTVKKNDEVLLLLTMSKVAREKELMKKYICKQQTKKLWRALFITISIESCNEI